MRTKTGTQAPGRRSTAGPVTLMYTDVHAVKVSAGLWPTSVSLWSHNIEAISGWRPPWPNHNNFLSRKKKQSCGMKRKQTLSFHKNETITWASVSCHTGVGGSENPSGQDTGQVIKRYPALDLKPIFNESKMKLLDFISTRSDSISLSLVSWSQLNGWSSELLVSPKRRPAAIMTLYGAGFDNRC